MSDPKAKFKKYVGAESGGGRPEGKGFITELQRQKLKPAHLEVIVTKNKERNHYPKRVSNEKWVEVKAELKRKQYQTKQAAVGNQYSTPEHSHCNKMRRLHQRKSRAVGLTDYARGCGLHPFE